MGRRQRVHIVDLAAGCLASVEPPAVPGGRPDHVVIGVLSGDVAHPLFDVGRANLVRVWRGLTGRIYTRHRVQRLCDRRAARDRQAERRNEQYGFDAYCFHLDDHFCQGW